MRIVLTVISGPLQGMRREFEPAPAILSIGRDPDRDFALRGLTPRGSDKKISRRHCVLEITDEVCRIRDTQSHNGVRINGVKIEQAELRTEDCIRLSRETTLRIEIEADSHYDTTQDSPSAAASWQALYDVLPSNPCLVCTEPRPLLGVICAACRAIRNAAPQPIPGYLLLRELGRGAMGVVWLAEERPGTRLVAIKLIHPEREATPAHIARFLDEAQYLRNMNHRNIINVTSATTHGQAEDLLYFVMDYLPGYDAAKLLKVRGPLPLTFAVCIIRDVLQGLAYAHAQNLIHRDIKPANILVVESPWTVVLADFGLAHRIHESQVSRLTHLNELGGTLPYLPPEQALGMTEATPASDQYGAAATLYTLLTGRTVHDLPSSLAEQIQVIKTQPAVSILQRRAGLSPALAAVIHRALELKPESRYPDVDSFSQALRPFSR